MYKSIIFDLDGTIYHGSKIIDGVCDVIERLKAQNKSIFFLTNNSAKSRQQILEKLLGMGIACKLDDIYNAGIAAAYFIKKEGLKQVYVFGTNHLKEELTSEEISICDTVDTAENMVIGFDPCFDYTKLTNAFRVALNVKSIIACNLEKSYPGEEGKLFPGCGPMVKAIEFASNKKVDYVIGKPNTLLLEMICKKHKFNPSEILMIGDSYESDIQMALSYGANSVYIGNEIHNNTICVKKFTELLDIFKL